MSRTSQATAVSAEMPKLSRRQRERLEHRQQMLDAALDLFSEKGYHDVSMHEIAQRAEFSIGTLYTFFENKEDLYSALMLDVSARFRASLTAAIESGADEFEKIRNYVQAKGEVFMSNVKVIRLYFAETRGASFNVRAELSQKLLEGHEAFLRKLANVFESGIKKKKFQKLDSYLLAASLDSLTNTALLLWLADPERNPYRRRVETMLKIFLEPVKIG
jgi:TetR/AcrR family transcriptional regulator